MPERPPFKVKLIYAMGQLGWSLASFGVLFQVAYFYLPPETGQRTFPPFIYQGAFFGFLTVIGLILFGGKIFDAFTDPIIANLSDKTKSGFGKRRKFLAISAIPLAIFSFLVFYPLSETDTILNSCWLIFSVLIFYLSFSLYVVPYNALISELGHHPDDRMTISTMISVSWALGHGLGYSVFYIKSIFEKSMPPTEAFQFAIGILVLLALFFMLIPVFFLNENKYSLQSTSSVSIIESLKTVWGNKNFRIFTYADLMYWLSVTIIQMGIIYYITILLRMEEKVASIFLPIVLVLSLVLYYPVNLIVQKKGKKPLVIVAFSVFAFTFLVALSLGKNPLPAYVQMGVLAVLATFPMAVFGILPNAIIADIVNKHGEHHSENHAGMYFAVRTFMMKLGISIGILVFTSSLIFGRSIENDMGIRLTGLAALLFCLLGLFFFNKYTDLHEFVQNEDVDEIGLDKDFLSSS